MTPISRALCLTSMLGLASCSIAPYDAAEADDTDTATSSVGAAGGVALLVVGGAGTAADSAVRARLERLGFTVTLRSDGVVTTADATGKRIVVISSSVASAKVAKKFRSVTVPVVTWEPQILDDMGLTAAGALGTRAGQTQLVIKTTSTDEMTPGLSGKPTVSSSSTYTWGKPAASAKVVATTTAGEAAIFRYASGSALVGLTAPARRVGFFMSDNTALGLTAAGKTLVDGAVSWAAQLPRLNKAACQTGSQCESGLCQVGVCTGVPDGSACTLDVQCASDACVSGICKAPILCGNGVVNAGEQCDTAGESATCDADCTLAMCGDGYLNRAHGEACDTGGNSPTCDSDCTPASCGDGFVNPVAGEQCDTAGESAGCNADCTIASCGDGRVNHARGEACDTGGNSPTCDSDCTPASCGDGFVNPVAGEQCDTAGESAGCNADCTIASCGDGRVNHARGEACDTGGDSVTCDSDCTPAVCGDGYLNRAAGEQCDDGNSASGDGCSFCRLE